MVSENAKARAAAAKQAESLIEQEALSYLRWAGEANTKGAIVDIRENADQLKQEALIKALKRLGAGDSPEQALNLLANTLTNRLLHQPLRALRDAPEDGDEEIVRIARLLLGKNSTS